MVNRSSEALLSRNEKLASEVFLTEPRINEMEKVIDEHAVRMLRGLLPDGETLRGGLREEEIRLIVATLRINNDLERMADLAVNICQRVLSLAATPGAEAPPELAPMCTAVRAMMSKCLGALIYQNVTLANEVLESDDVVDQYRDRVFEQLLAAMTGHPMLVAPHVQYVLASRYLERIADHTTNIAEDVVYWVRGLDVRHGRALELDLADGAEAAAGNPDNSIPSSTGL
jgi:phosphate transport system protein